MRLKLVSSPRLTINAAIVFNNIIQLRAYTYPRNSNTVGGCYCNIIECYVKRVEGHYRVV